MAERENPSIHASAVLIGAHALLIRGPAGSGKSQLVLALLQAGTRGWLPFVRLVADDRVFVGAANGRLLVQPVPELAGLLEVHGLGIRRLPYEPVAVVSRVIDLSADDSARLPEVSAEEATVSGILLPRIAVREAHDPLRLVLAALGSKDAVLAEN
jgi:HPr kinase/phosphorylase